MTSSCMRLSVPPGTSFGEHNSILYFQGVSLSFYESKGKKRPLGALGSSLTHAVPMSYISYTPCVLIERLKPNPSLTFELALRPIVHFLLSSVLLFSAPRLRLEISCRIIRTNKHTFSPTPIIQNSTVPPYIRRQKLLITNVLFTVGRSWTSCIVQGQSAFRRAVRKRACKWG